MNKGFTLIEVMVIIVIISILVSISIPIYQSYIIRAQVINIISETEQYKTFINYTYSQTGFCPSQIEIDQINNTQLSTSFISTSILSLPTTNSCQISFTLRNTKISSKLANKHLDLIFEINNIDNDTGHWKCKSIDISNIYLPNHCK